MSLAVTGLGTNVKHITDFFAPFWAQAYNCSNGSCAPKEFFQKSFQILYITTYDSTEVNVTVMYQITNGSWGTLVTHFITAKPRETTVFDVLSAFAEDLEAIAENATSDIHHPWWIDQPVHIQVLGGGGFVSMYAVSTIVNDTSVFPLYPIFPSETDLSKLVVDSKDLTSSLHYISAEVLIIKPLFSQTEMHIALTVEATALCSLNFDYAESCDSELQLIPLEPSSYYTTWKSNDALVLVTTDSPKDHTFDLTNITTDKPTSVFLGKIGSVTMTEGTLSTSLVAQQMVDSRFWGHTFITVISTATLISSSQPPFFNIMDGYNEITRWYYDQGSEDNLPVVQYYTWDSSLNFENFTVYGNQLSAHVNRITLERENVAVIRNFTARSTVVAGIYYIDDHRQEHSTLLTIPPVEKYQNRYTLPDPRYHLIELSRDAATDLYLITVIVPHKYFSTGNIMLDGKPIPRDGFLSFNTSEGPAFYATKVKLDYVNLTHELYHTHQDGRFGITVFGFTGNGESTRNLYAFSSASQIESELATSTLT